MDLNSILDDIIGVYDNTPEIADDIYAYRDEDIVTLNYQIDKETNEIIAPCGCYKCNNSIQQGIVFKQSNRSITAKLA